TNRDGVDGTRRKSNICNIAYTSCKRTTVTTTDKDRNALRRQCAQALIDSSHLTRTKCSLVGTIAYTQYLHLMIRSHPVKPLNQILGERRLTISLIIENLRLW